MTRFCFREREHSELSITNKYFIKTYRFLDLIVCVCVCVCVCVRDFSQQLEGCSTQPSKKSRMEQKGTQDGKPNSSLLSLFKLDRVVPKMSACVTNLWLSEISGPGLVATRNAETGASAKSLQSCLTLCDPMDCSPPGSLSMGFSGQEYWSGLPFPSPGDVPNPGTEPASSTLAGRFFTRPVMCVCIGTWASVGTWACRHLPKKVQGAQDEGPTFKGLSCGNPPSLSSVTRLEI